MREDGGKEAGGAKGVGEGRSEHQDKEDEEVRDRGQEEPERTCG